MNVARRLNRVVLTPACLIALVAVLGLLAASCADGSDAGERSVGAEATHSPVEDEPVAPDEEVGEVPLAGDAEGAAPVQLPVPVPLPEREGPRTETTFSVPHVQAFVEPVPEVDAELRRRIYSLPGLENRDTITSVAGTTALWLSEEFQPSDLVATMREREFGHVHPDGSLHTVLPVERAREATAAKWAELHPWVGRDDFWDGLVMLYTPQSFEELEVTWQLIVDSYNFVTGQSLSASDFIPDQD